MWRRGSSRTRESKPTTEKVRGGKQDGQNRGLQLPTRNGRRNYGVQRGLSHPERLLEAGGCTNNRVYERKTRNPSLRQQVITSAVQDSLLGGGGKGSRQRPKNKRLQEIKRQSEKWKKTVSSRVTILLLYGCSISLFEDVMFLLMIAYYCYCMGLPMSIYGRRASQKKVRDVYCNPVRM